MAVHNAEIAELFDEYADLLEVDGANPYRIRAYRTAARNLANLSRSAAEMVKRGEDLAEIPGLGKDLAAKVVEIVNTGRLARLEELEQKLPRGLVDITHISGLGPKRALALHRQLGIKTVTELEEAAREGRVKLLPGFGAKSEQNILEEIARKAQFAGAQRRKLADMERLALPLLEYLTAIPCVRRVEIAGSYRRRQETIGDLDMLVVCDNEAEVMDRFVSYDAVGKVIARGPTRSSVLLRFGVQVDLRVVPEAGFGAALLYFTGSQAHNIAVRLMGVRKGLKLNEYGVFRGRDWIGGATEEEVYRLAGLPYIEPELREDRGEIEAALAGGLPRLVELSDIKGDLHAHTRATDGRAGLEDMAEAARRKGYEYLAITEHSRHLGIARGLDVERLAEHITRIDVLNEKLTGIALLKSIEVDILEDGSLDLPDEILQRLDLVVGAVHYKFNLPEDKQTERMLRAMQNPLLTVLAHPTGRIIGVREPYGLDMERIMQTARDCGCALELNAQPDRLDLNDVYCKMAREYHVPLAVSTDAHSVDELDFMRYGVYQARRGWLEKGDVLNTRTLRELLKAR